MIKKTFTNHILHRSYIIRAKERDLQDRVATTSTLVSAIAGKLSLLAILLTLIFITGCDRSDGTKGRIQASLVACRTNLLLGDSRIKAALRQKVTSLVERATPESIKRPELGAVVFWGSQENPVADFWWTQDSPSADGLILRWPINSQGTYLRVPQEILTEFRNDKSTNQLILYSLVIPLKGPMADGLELPPSGIEAALAKDGQAISPFISCDSFLPAPSTTTTTSPSR